MPDTLSDYARYFDQANSNWNHTLEYNMLFLRAQQNYFNDKLQMRGHVFLNEVYESLGLPITKAGHFAGWVIERDKSAPYISFGLNEFPVAKPSSSILLDFNADTDITERILWEIE